MKQRPTQVLAYGTLRDHSVQDGTRVNMLLDKMRGFM
jgi:hypothetical protein